MRNLFAFFTLIVFLHKSSVAQSIQQHIVSGIVMDSLPGKPIANVSVTLKNSLDSNSGTSTNEKGVFIIQNLAPGNYTLLFSFVGFSSKTAEVSITVEKPVVDIGTIQLVRDSNKLSDVTVTGLKALVEDKGDRLVYNAEKDISNTGGTAADVLRKVPTITVDLDGNVQMRGNSNIKVLINGKPSAMMARNLADALRQMPASVIKTIEVITSPGAKYDAEGSAGVINIITKKGLQGFSGSVTATAGNFNRGLGTRFTLKKKKISLSLSANGYQYRNIREGSTFRTTMLDGKVLNRLSQESSAKNTGTGGYGEMSFEYDHDSSSRISLTANVWGGYYPNNSTTFNRLTNPENVLLQSFRNESRFKNPYGNGQIDLGYTKSFKKPDQEFSLLTQFSRMPDNYFYDIDNYSSAEEIFFRQHSTNYSRNKEYTIQTDYIHPFIVKGKKDTTNIKAEIGIKTIIRDIGSEFRVDQATNGHSPLIPEPSLSNDFDYIQRVYSGYTSLRINTTSKWSINAGARIERTRILGDFLTTQTKLDNQYNNIIPSITVSKKIKTHTFKTSYTQRIQRPMLWYLNPWINASDPKNLVTGNPFLTPELNHAVEVAHSLSGANGLSLNTALYWRFNNNAIQYLSTVDTAGISTLMPQNIGRRKAVGINVNVSSQPTKKWNLNGGTDVRYEDLRSKSMDQQIDGVLFNVNLNTTYKLPKDYTIQANGNFNSGWMNLQGKSTGFYWYGFSGKRELLKKKATLTLGINNPFNQGVKQTRNQSAPTFESVSKY
ncbi:MAG: TonB-dependent receptor, partial [Segetibacter sp.]|nr:TonB-dependent receptor [Segetibacter sp.]